MRHLVVAMLCALLLMPLGASAQLPVSVPMDAQINLGYTYSSQSPNGDAIYPAFNANTQTIYGPGVLEPEGFTRHNLLTQPGTWYYQYVDFNLAGFSTPAAGLDLSGPCARIEFDTRFFHDENTNSNPYADAPVFVRIYTYASDGNTYLGFRDYSIVYATQGPWSNPRYPEWTRVVVFVNQPGYTQGGVFNVTNVSRLRFYGTNWAGGGNDFVDFKNVLVRDDIPPPAINPMPDPDSVYPNVEYIRQMSATQCDTVLNWSLISGPSGMVVSASGAISGWAPAMGQVGQSIPITVRATNSAGFSDLTWNVLVATPPQLDGSNVAAPWGTLHGNIFATQSSSDPSLMFLDSWAQGPQVAWRLNLSSAGLTGGTERGGISFDEEANLYFKTTEGFLVSVAPDGTIRWTGQDGGNPLDLGLGDTTTPVVGDGGPTGRVYVLSNTGAAAFAKSDGALLWEAALPGANFSDATQGANRLTPVLYDGILYVIGVGSPEKVVYAISAGNGDVVWQTTIAVDLDRGWGDAKGAITLIPDVFGSGIHGLYFNADGAGNTPSKDMYAISANSNAFTGSLVWTADGGKSTKSHAVYSQVTGRLYTATWGDDGKQFYSFDPVTGAVVSNNSPEGSGSGYNDFAALDFSGTDVIAAGFGGNILRYQDTGDGSTTSTYYPTNADYGEFRMYGGLYQNADGDSIAVMPTRSGLENAQVIAVNLTAEPSVTCQTFNDSALYVDNLKITQGATGTENTVFDSAGFEGYALGNLPGQGNPGGVGSATWEDNTGGGPSGVGMVQVINSLPDRAGKGLMLDANGGCGGYQGAFARMASAIAGDVVVVSWEQYRGDLTDNIWLSDNSDYSGWWTYGWDQNGKIFARNFGNESDVGVNMTAGVWQTIRYTFNFNSMTVTVEVVGSGSSSRALEAAENSLDGWNMEIEGTLKSDLVVPPTNTIFTYDTGMYGTGGAQILTGLQMGPMLAGAPQQIYYFEGVGGSLVALAPPVSIPGDFDRDGDVDRDDLAMLMDCAAGPQVLVLTPSCSDEDMNGDGFIDMLDFAAWQRCYSGQDIPGDPDCYP